MHAVFDVAPLPGCHPEIGILAASLIDSSREWRDELGQASEDQIVWQARPGGHSIGAELLHIAEVEIWWLHHIVCGRPMDPEESKLLMSEQIMQDEGQWPTPHRLPLEWYLGILDSVRERTLALLPEMGDPERMIHREKWNHDYSVRWIWSHVVQHDSYHGGQAVLLKDLAPQMP